MLGFHVAVYSRVPKRWSSSIVSFYNLRISNDTNLADMLRMVTPVVEWWVSQTVTLETGVRFPVEEVFISWIIFSSYRKNNFFLFLTWNYMKFAFFFSRFKALNLVSDSLKPWLSAPSFLLGLYWDEKKLLFSKNDRISYCCIQQDSWTLIEFYCVIL